MNNELLPENARAFPSVAFRDSCEDAHEAECYDPGEYLGFVITPQGRYDIWSFNANAKAGGGFTGYFGLGTRADDDPDPEAQDGDYITGEMQTGFNCIYQHPEDDMPNLTRMVQDPMYGSGIAVNMAKGVEGVLEG